MVGLWPVPYKIRYVLILTVSSHYCLTEMLNPGPGGGALSLFDSNYGVDVDTVRQTCKFQERGSELQAPGLLRQERTRRDSHVTSEAR